MNEIRKSIFARLLFAYVVLGLVAYIPSVVMAVLHEYWLIVAIDTIGYLIIVLFIVKTEIKIEKKIIGTLIISSAIGIILLFNVGPFGAGYLWLFVVPIISAVLLKFWYSIIALAINVIILAVIGILLHQGVLNWGELYAFNWINWLIVSANFVLLNVATTLSLAVLIQRLEKSLKLEIDYTNKLAAEHNELLKAIARAERANSLKSEFLAQMSHEIRTPINTIMNFISLVEEITPKNDELIDEYFKIIQLGSMRITRTIDSILNMSELQSGSYEPSFIEFNLCEEILKPLFVEFKLNASNKDLDFNLALECNNFKYSGDLYTVTQLFANLFDNAIKYTQEGHVSVSASTKNNRNFMVTVTDSGIGMSADFLERIFEPFSQEEEGYTRKFEGTGLGLSLVKKYAEINKLRIDVQSEKNVGTTFSIIFDSEFCR